MPVLSFNATVNAITLIGGQPIFVDVSQSGNGFDLKDFRRALDCYQDIKAIILVHLFGHPFPMESIFKIAREKNIPVIEDSAQWFLPIQSSADSSSTNFRCFSFDPTKNIFSGGSLGAVLTNSTEHAESLRSIRSHGLSLSKNPVQFFWSGNQLEAFRNLCSNFEPSPE